MFVDEDDHWINDLAMFCLSHKLYEKKFDIKVEDNMNAYLGRSIKVFTRLHKRSSNYEPGTIPHTGLQPLMKCALHALWAQLEALSVWQGHQQLYTFCA